MAYLRLLAETTDMRPRDIATAMNERFPPVEGAKPAYSRSSVIGKAFRERLKIKGATMLVPAPKKPAIRCRPTSSKGPAPARRDTASQGASRHSPQKPVVPRTTDVMRLKIRAGAASLQALHQSLIDQHDADGGDLYDNPIKSAVICPEARDLWEETVIYHPATMPDGRCQHPTCFSRKTRTQLFCGSPTEKYRTYCEPHGRLNRPS